MGVLLFNAALSSTGRFSFTLLSARAKARPFDLGSLCFWSAVPCPVSPGSWPGGAWVPSRASPSFCFVVFVVG